MDDTEHAGCGATGEVIPAVIARCQAACLVHLGPWNMWQLGNAWDWLMQRLLLQHSGLNLLLIIHIFTLSSGLLLLPQVRNSLLVCSTQQQMQEY